MRRVRAAGCIVVDTTCGSVLNVWKSVERLARDGFTVVMHGNPDHEETRATLSRVDAAGGRWMVIRTINEARSLAEGIRDCGLRIADCGLDGWSRASGSTGDRDLQRIGLAHQTTMLASESRAIATLLREAVAARWGNAALPDRFRDFDTICTATQERQDAVEKLCGGGLSLCLVVGGRTSHNTAHLAEVAARFVPAFHVEGPDDLKSPTEIRHWVPSRFPVSGLRSPVVADLSEPKTGNGKPETRDGRAAIRHGWLPNGAVAVGVAAGASTPDAVTGAVVERLLDLTGDH